MSNTILKYNEKIVFESVSPETTEKYIYTIPNSKKYPHWNFEQLQKFKESLNPYSFKKKIFKDRHILEIYFTPFGPSKCYTTYVSITNYGEEDYILCITGTSEVIRVRTTVKHILFFRLKNESKIKTYFEIHNDSEKTAIQYQFDIDNSQKIFDVCPISGIIEPKKYEYVFIKFLTEKNGVFFLDLPLLVHLHQPIFIELLGINSYEETLQKFRGQISKISLENGYEKYLTHTFGWMDSDSTPILKITQNDYEFSIPNFKGTNEILNLTDKFLRIIWDIEAKNEFIALPKELCLRQNERLEFVTKFQPQKFEKLHGGQIYGRGIIFGNKKIEDDPDSIIFPINLRYIGNSFKKLRPWNPNTNFGSIFTFLPYCTPNSNCFTSIILPNFGKFPLVFNIIGPKYSNFCVKPNCGIIPEDYQILIVKFSGLHLSNAIKKEKWQIQFNQNENYSVDLYLEAHVIKPRLKFGKNNEIDFGKVFPGCKKYLMVPVFNKTPIKIKYTFKANKWFSVEPDTDYLTCFEVKTVTFCYLSDCDVPEISDFSYEMRVLQDETLVEGPPYFGKVILLAQWGYGKLCATPSFYDFETILCAEVITTKFTIHNFSEVTIPFVLKTHEHYGSCDLGDMPVKLSPKIASVDPGEQIDVLVKIQDFESCLRSYFVQYMIREDENSDNLVKNQGISFPTSGLLFKIYYYSFYPTVQFTDIAKNSTGPLFSNVNVWEYLQIVNLNTILRTIKINETETYNLRLPDAENDLEISKSIVVILKNTTREDTSIRFERKKICDCELKQVQTTSRINSFRKFNYENCPHRQILFITAEQEDIKAFDYTFVKIDINYILLGPQEACFILHLSHNRKVELYFKVKGLSSGELSTYHYGLNLKMNRVYIGEMNPDQQIFWFFNNTRSDTTYDLDISPLEEYNNFWGHPVLICLNPSGSVEAKTVQSIQFLFAPIAAGKVDLALPFEFGSQNEILHILGSGHINYSSPMEEVYFTDLGREYIKYPDSEITFSTQNIIIRAIPTHCVTRRLLTMKNESEDVVGFTFDSYYLENTIEISILPISGTIESGEILPLVMKISTYGISCKIRACVHCHFVNDTQLQKHFRTQSLYHQQLEMRSANFIIGENGKITYPSVGDLDITPSPTVWHKLISITSHIIQKTEMDTKMPVKDQIKQTPFESISIYQQNRLTKYLTPRHETKKHLNKTKSKSTISQKRSCEFFSNENYAAVHTILSCLIHDFIYSKKFQYYFKLTEDCFQSYTELKTELITEEEEKEAAKLEVNHVPLSLLAETMQVLVADSLLKHFEIGQYPEVICDYKINPVRNTESGFGMKVYSEKFAFLLNDNE